MPSIVRSKCQQNSLGLLGISPQIYNHCNHLRVTKKSFSFFPPLAVHSHNRTLSIKEYYPFLVHISRWLATFTHTHSYSWTRCTEHKWLRKEKFIFAQNLFEFRHGIEREHTVVGINRKSKHRRRDCETTPPNMRSVRKTNGQKGNAQAYSRRLNVI